MRAYKNHKDSENGMNEAETFFSRIKQYSDFIRKMNNLIVIQ